MHTSASLNTNSIWQNTIGHDPYAAEGESSGGAGEANESGYDQFKGLLKLASAQYGVMELYISLNAHILTRATFCSTL
jgi:hypothetical protein